MKAAFPEPEIVTHKGKPVTVIIPIKNYEELLERVEDADDMAWLKRARRKPLHYRPLEDYLAEHNRSVRVNRVRHRREVYRGTWSEKFRNPADELACLHPPKGNDDFKLLKSQKMGPTSLAPISAERRFCPPFQIP